MFRFPWSNFHELNLDWILEVVKEAKEIFVNGRSDIDNAVDTANEALEVAEQAAAAVIADGAITIPKLNNEVLKTTAYVIVGNRADEAVPAGAYVYLRNSLVSGLADGIYTAAANIPAGAIVTPTEFQQSTALRDSGALNVLKNTLNQLDTATQRIIPILPGSTNNLGYTLNIGDYFEAGGVLYKVTTAIPNTETWAGKASALTDTVVNDLKNSITPQNGIYLGIMTKTVSNNKTLVIIPLSGIDLSKYSISCTLLQVGGDSFTIDSTDKYVGGLAFWISGDWTTNYSGKEAKATLYFTRV